MFVTADWDAQGRATVFHAQSARCELMGLHAVHFITDADNAIGAVRANGPGHLAGRNREPSQPLADFGPITGPGPCTTDDPIAALSTRIVIPAYGSVYVTFGTAAAASRDVLDRRRSLSPDAGDRAAA
jgi:hypothetical protein